LLARNLIEEPTWRWRTLCTIGCHCAAHKPTQINKLLDECDSGKYFHISETCYVKLKHNWSRNNEFGGILTRWSNFANNNFATLPTSQVFCNFSNFAIFLWSSLKITNFYIEMVMNFAENNLQIFFKYLIIYNSI